MTGTLRGLVHQRRGPCLPDARAVSRVRADSPAVPGVELLPLPVLSRSQVPPRELEAQVSTDSVSFIARALDDSRDISVFSNELWS
jgi:hypothetical protein